eukprot:g5472.t1
MGIREEGGQRECFKNDCRGVGKGFDEKTKSCIECPVNTFKWNRYGDKCKKCAHGQSTNGKKGQKSCSYCPHGHGMDYNTQTCKVCPVNYHSAKRTRRSSPCEKCAPGKSTLGKVGQKFCVGKCPGIGIGFDETTNSCVKCPINTFNSYTNEDSCEKCSIGRYTDGKIGQKYCELCDRGKEMDDKTKTCHDCPVNTYSKLDMWRKGSLKAFKKCVKCPYGKSTNGKTGQEKCEYCPRGHEMDYKTQTCRVCQVNYHSVSRSRCKKCARGKSTHGKVGQRYCRQCQPGEFLDKNTKNCKKCPVDTYNGLLMDVEKCNKCSSKKSTYGKIGQTSCKELCEAGTELIMMEEESLRFKSISPTSRKTPFYVAKSNCKACPINTYKASDSKEQNGPAKCKACPVGKSTFGENEQAKCENCGFGEVFDVKTKECKPCPVDTYRKDKSKNRCLPCQNSLSTLGLSRQSDCGRCPKGKEYNTVTGKCEACPVNTFKPGLGGVMVNGFAKCYQCRKSMRTAALRKDIFWSLDTTNGTTGQTSEKSCKCLPGSSRQKDGKCVFCKKGTYRSKNMTESKCEACVNGIVSYDSSMCIKTCPAGTEINFYEIKNTGSCATDSAIIDAPACYRYYLQSNNNLVYQPSNKGFLLDLSSHPPGCIRMGQRTFFNLNLKSEAKCEENKNCICRRKDPCKPCEVNFFKANNDLKKKCEECPIVNGKKMVTYGLKGQTACSLPCNPGNAPSYSDIKSSDIVSDTFEAKYNKTSRKFNLQWKDAGSTSTIDYISELPVTHTCKKYISSKAECELAARANFNFKVDKNYGFEPNPKNETVRIAAVDDKGVIIEVISFILDKYSPPGCYFDTRKNKYGYNSYYDEALKQNQKIPIEVARGKVKFGNKYFTNLCNIDKKCICKPTKQTLQCTDPSTSMCPIQPTCSPCEENTFSEGKGTFCQPCKDTETSKTGSSFCESLVYQKIMKDLIAQKEKHNDLSFRNSRLWQKEETRLEHDKIMQERKEKDNKKEQKDCKDERKKGTVIFPAMEISQEIEKIEDTTCLDMNRDELLKSFCSLTSDLDELFGSQGIEKKANSFFPNICCKERRDTTLDVCEDLSGKINRSDIIPFALSQGGNYSRHNLYAEVSDALKINGYLHKGMTKMLKSLKKDANNKDILKMVDAFFHDISLCGPRIINAPGNNENTFCQLFVPYQHAMKGFYKLVHSMYDSPKLRAQAAGPDVSFLQIMERSFRKRQYRLGKNNGVKNIGAVMQTKAASPKVTDEKCSRGSPWTKKELKEIKGTICEGYKHLDLSTPQINNFAVQYIEPYINEKCAKDNKCMEILTTSLRYKVIDTTCPSPLFTANDISLQKINMDGLGNVKKEWAAVVKLNTKSENGYLKSELPYCKARDYLIGTKVVVKGYVDVDSCCDGLVDYEECKKKESCQNGENLATLNDVNEKHFSMDVKLTGTWYKVKDSHSTELGRRRRLLMKGKASSC